jgi:hypothetical protein
VNVTITKQKQSAFIRPHKLKEKITMPEACAKELGDNFTMSVVAGQHPASPTTFSGFSWGAKF